MSARSGLPSKIEVDGYALDLSGGVSSGQALVYNGVSFTAQSVSGGGSGFDYGSGIDGAGSFTDSSTNTVTRPLYFTTLVVDNSVINANSDPTSINTTYIDITAQTSITIQNGATITVLGNSGGTGGSDGTAGTSGSGNGLGSAGAVGGNGGTGTGAAGATLSPTITYASAFLGAFCIAGAAGGAGGAGPNGSGGSATGTVENNYFPPFGDKFVGGYKYDPNLVIAPGGNGGSGGGGNGSTSGAGGGGGGGGAGAIVLRSPIITLNSGCGILAGAGNGGAGGGAGFSGSGGGGGGGGGHGGLIILVCETLNAAGNIFFNAGAGGTGGSGAKASFTITAPGSVAEVVIMARTAGIAGSSIAFTLSGTSAPSAGVVLIDGSNLVTITYENGVSTYGDLFNAINTSSQVESAAHFGDDTIMTSPGSDVGSTNLAGGADPGSNGDDGNSGEAWHYQPSTNTWTQLGVG